MEELGKFKYMEYSLDMVLGYTLYLYVYYKHKHAKKVNNINNKLHLFINNNN